MINMPYLQTFITTRLLHLEQSLTQQRSVGWIRVSKGADVNIYYKLFQQFFADRSIAYGFHLQPDSPGSHWDDFCRSQTNAISPGALTPQQLGRGLMSLSASQTQ